MTMSKAASKAASKTASKSGTEAGTRSAAPRPLPPWLEQSLLFGLFAAAALFWIAVIWWIVR